MDQDKIGKFLAQCRKEKNMTQEKLAELLSVSNKSISRWENGKTLPDYSILKDLCNALDIDVNEFLSGERIETSKKQMYNIDNLDLVLKEYYKMKKQKNFLKAILILIACIILNIAIAYGILGMIGLFGNLEITENVSDYQNVIGINAEEKYKNKWGMSEDIFPNSVEDLNVRDFKMVYYDPWDKQYLSYLVVDYNEEDYIREVERLKKCNIEEYIGYYGATGFSNYSLLAMESDSYQGFVYAITDNKSKIIYVELIFCNYFMDIDYEKYIPLEYLPDDIDLKVDNDYRKEKLHIN